MEKGKKTDEIGAVADGVCGEGTVSLALALEETDATAELPTFTVLMIGATNSSSAAWHPIRFRQGSEALRCIFGSDSNFERIYINIIRRGSDSCNNRARNS